MNCPYCGKKMQSGKLIINGRSVLSPPLWKADEETYDLMDKLLYMDGNEIYGLEISGWDRTKIEAHHCPDCKKFIFDGWV